MPFGLFLIVLNLYAYIDSVMLGVMRGDVETGVYGAAYKVYEGVGYLPGVVASVLTPRLSSLFMTDRSAHKRLMLTGLIGSVSLALVVGVLGYWLAEPLLVLLFGANFAVAAAPFRILCLGLVFVFAIWTLHAAAISVNKERLLLRAALDRAGRQRRGQPLRGSALRRQRRRRRDRDRRVRQPGGPRDWTSVAALPIESCDLASFVSRDNSRGLRTLSCCHGSGVGISAIAAGSDGT